MRSLCGVQSHSLPVTSASRLSYWKTFIPAAPLCSGCGRLRFSYPRGLHVSFHLALGGPFTGTASVRLPPSRTLCETVSRFYFLVIGLKYHNMLIYYHHCGGQSRVFIASRVSGFPGLWLPGSLSPPGSLPPTFPLTRSSSRSFARTLAGF